MKIEFTRAEVEAILLNHASQLTGQEFNVVEPTGYRSMPDGFVVRAKPQQEPADAAQ